MWKKGKNCKRSLFLKVDGFRFDKILWTREMHYGQMRQKQSKERMCVELKEKLSNLGRQNPL